MIDNNQAGQKAVHKLIIESRIKAQQGDCKQVFNLLDKIEYLIALIIEMENRSHLFNQYLKATCEEFNLINIYKEYSRYL